MGVPEVGAPVTATRGHGPRDRYVDLLRAVAILTVVTGHWLAVAVSVHHGQITGGNAGVDELQSLPWMRPMTWLFQVMPVFFLVGGYANAASWSSHRRRGGDGASWVRSRVLRLLRPTAIFLVVLAVAAELGRMAGLAAGTVRAATWVAAISLWFIAVYIAVVALAPMMITWQRRLGPVRVFATLVAGVGLVDLARLTAGPTLLAVASYLLGWLAIHQLGVAWRDGALTASRYTPWLLAGGGLLCLLVLTGPGPYAVSMIGAVGSGLANDMPPTVALLALAGTQAGVIVLVRGRVDHWLARPRPWAAVLAVNSVVLTVYLWHMVPILVVAPALVLTGVLPPYPIGSAGWLLWRLPWMLALALVLLLLVAVVGRWERPRPHDAAAARRDTAPGATTRLVAGVLACLAGLAGLVATRFAGVAGTTIPVVELAAFVTGLVLVSGWTPVVGRRPLARR